MRSVCLAAVVVAGAALTGVAATQTAPSQFRLVFEGSHNDALLHFGTFTASGFCTSGLAADIGTIGEAGLRRFTCAGGNGTFDARISPLPAEHRGGGTWQIIAGSGELAKLRGRGSFTSDLIAGDLDNPPTIKFRSTWQGVVDLDDAPPTIAFARVTAQKLRRPARTYLLRVAFTAQDAAAGTRVAYTATLLVGIASYLRTGTTTGLASLSIRFRAPRRVRTAQIRVRAADPLGNEGVTTRAIRLPLR
jgi:hypothetical protein